MTEEKIQRNVLEQLSWESRLRPAEIGVRVKEGVVTLTGTVDSYSKKWRAEQAALRVAGVKAVVNQIEVRLAEADVRTDEDIARAARRVLDETRDLPDTIKVVVDKGWITLTGDVEWYWQKEAAERKVQDLVGVKGVTNLVEVKPKLKPEDLKRRIEQALLRLAETDAKNIEVDVRDGHVILKGRVHSWYEKEEAKREAWLAPGVREVVDQLQIAY
jgi:osmotically-inducible protein OsmY